jgi:hypothetical protein
MVFFGTFFLLGVESREKYTPNTPCHGNVPTNDDGRKFANLFYPDFGSRMKEGRHFSALKFILSSTVQMKPMRGNAL